MQIVKNPRSNYTQEFKVEAVKLVLDDYHKASLQVVKYIQDKSNSSYALQSYSACVKKSLPVEIANQKKCNKEIKDIVDESLFIRDDSILGEKYAQRETTDYWVSIYYSVGTYVNGGLTIVLTDKNLCKVHKVFQQK